MDRTGFQRWLDAYVGAWRSNDRPTIEALFSEDARYFYGPYAEPVIGRAAIAASWLGDQDAPDSWAASYTPLAVDGDVFVATGESRYLVPDGTAERTAYSNIYVCRFDAEGRCTEFREWFMERPTPRTAEATAEAAAPA
jgi:ketosteroid isomerase-like protein